MMLVTWKQQGEIGNVGKTKKTLTAKEFDKKYPHLKDHADYKNYDRRKKLSTTGYISNRKKGKKNSK